jgi:hypothetical protein
MKALARIFMVLLVFSVSLPHAARAVSWSPLQEEREEKIAQGIMVKGTILCLFQSGTADVKKAINVNDVLSVFREGKSHNLKEVGKIKILSYSGEDYLKGVVIEGEVKAGDIAKKGDVASLIISSDDKCK